jgi:hypothetical protein
LGAGRRRHRRDFGGEYGGRLDTVQDTEEIKWECVLMGHPERFMPFCIKHYRILDNADHVIVEVTDNHQTHNSLTLEWPDTTDRLQIEVLESHGPVPAALCAVRCYV